MVGASPPLVCDGGPSAPYSVLRGVSGNGDWKTKLHFRQCQVIRIRLISAEGWEKTPRVVPELFPPLAPTGDQIFAWFREWALSGVFQAVEV